MVRHYVANQVSIMSHMLGGLVFHDMVRATQETEREFLMMSAILKMTAEKGQDVTGSIEALNEQMLRLGTTTMHGAPEVAAAMRELAAAGLDAEQVALSVQATLNLASAGWLKMGDSAKIVTQALSEFDMTADEASRVADVLANASVRTRTRITDMGLALSYVGASAANLNIDFESTVATLGTLSKAGLAGSRAGTGLNTVFNQMAKAEIKGKLDAFNITILDTKNQLLPLPDIIDNFNKGMEGMSPVAQQAALSALFTVRGMTAMMTLMRKGGDTIRELTDELDNSTGKAEELRRTLEQGLTGGLRVMRAAASTVAYDMGRRFTILPMIAEMAVRLAQGFVGMSERAKDLVTSVVEVVGSFALFNILLPRLIGLLGLFAGAFLGPMRLAYAVTRMLTIGFKSLFMAVLFGRGSMAVVTGIGHALNSLMVPIRYAAAGLSVAAAALHKFAASHLASGLALLGRALNSVGAAAVRAAQAVWTFVRARAAAVWSGLLGVLGRVPAAANAAWAALRRMAAAAPAAGLLVLRIALISLLAPIIVLIASFGALGTAIWRNLTKANFAAVISAINGAVVGLIMALSAGAIAAGRFGRAIGRAAVAAGSAGWAGLKAALRAPGLALYHLAAAGTMALRSMMRLASTIRLVTAGGTRIVLLVRQFALLRNALILGGLAATILSGGLAGFGVLTGSLTTVVYGLAGAIAGFATGSVGFMIRRLAIARQYAMLALTGPTRAAGILKAALAMVPGGFLGGMRQMAGLIRSVVGPALRGIGSAAVSGFRAAVSAAARLTVAFPAIGRAANWAGRQIAMIWRNAIHGAGVAAVWVGTRFRAAFAAVGQAASWAARQVAAYGLAALRATGRGIAQGLVGAASAFTWIARSAMMAGSNIVGMINPLRLMRGLMGGLKAVASGAMSALSLGISGATMLLTGGLIGAIIALGVGLAGAFKDKGPLGEEMNKTWHETLDLLNEIGGAILGVGEDGTAFESLKNMALDFMKALRDFLKDNKAEIIEVGTVVKGILVGAFVMLWERLKQIWELVQPVWESIKEFAQTHGPQIREVVVSIIQIFTNLFDIIKQGWQVLMGVIGGFFSWLGETTGVTVGGMMDFFTRFFDRVAYYTNDIGKTFRLIWLEIKKSWFELVQNIEAKIYWIKGLFQALWDAVAAGATALWSNLMAVFDRIGVHIQSVFAGIKAAILEGLDPTSNKSISQAYRDAFGAKAGELSQSVKDFQSIGKAMGDAWTAGFDKHKAPGFAQEIGEAEKAINDLRTEMDKLHADRKAKANQLLDKITGKDKAKGPGGGKLYKKDEKEPGEDVDKAEKKIEFVGLDAMYKKIQEGMDPTSKASMEKRNSKNLDIIAAAAAEQHKDAEDLKKAIGAIAGGAAVYR